jgi:uncharacterized protein DUF6265
MSGYSLLVLTAALKRLNCGAGGVKHETYAAILICLCCATLSLSGVMEKPSVGDFSWLAGCWEGGRPGVVREEQWTKPAGGSMLGMGRTVANAKTVEFEFMRIHQDKEEIFYTARPSGQPEASFKLVSQNGQAATFENPQHDFPQRVIYRRQQDGSLLARIEGTVNGKDRAIDFPFKRARCD